MKYFVFAFMIRAFQELKLFTNMLFISLYTETIFIKTTISEQISECTHSVPHKIILQYKG